MKRSLPCCRTTMADHANAVLLFRGLFFCRDGNLLDCVCAYGWILVCCTGRFLQRVQYMQRLISDRDVTSCAVLDYNLSSSSHLELCGCTPWCRRFWERSVMHQSGMGNSLIRS